MLRRLSDNELLALLNDLESAPPFDLLEKTLGKLGREHCQQHGVRLDRPVKAYDKWVQRIPRVYREA